MQPQVRQLKGSERAWVAIGRFSRFLAPVAIDWREGDVVGRNACGREHRFRIASNLSSTQLDALARSRMGGTAARCVVVTTRRPCLRSSLPLPFSLRPLTSGGVASDPARHLVHAAGAGA
jgi:hypothetical protein